MKITKLDKRFALCKYHGFKFKIKYETFPEWEIIYEWSVRTFGDFIVLPPCSHRPDERDWGITLGEEYEIYYKDEGVLTMLLLMVDSNP